MVGNHTANAVGSLFVLQRHIARRPTLGNAKHVRGARRRSLFGGALVCIVCAGRDAVPLSVRPSVRQSRVKGQVRAKSGSTTTTLLLLLLLYLPTYILDISPTALRCTPSGLAGQVVVARIESPALARSS